MTADASAPDRQPAGLDQPAEGHGSAENLALLYQGLLTGIVRLQARRQTLPDANTFRRRTKTMLQEVERAAVSAGYDGRDVSDTHFAVVALLDSVVLHSSDPVRSEWERKTLQEEIFGQTDAGVVFFEKLERLMARRDSPQLGDVLEVYLLCLLLGFEGRYSGGMRGELDGITERLRARIEQTRGTNQPLSPTGGLPREAALHSPAPAAPRPRPQWIALGALIATMLCFALLKLSLVWTSGQVRDDILRTLTGLQ